MSGEETHPVETLAREWAAAWNACDAKRLLALVHSDFLMYRMRGDVIDPDGSAGSGRAPDPWATMKIIPLRLYGHGNRFAAAARVEYRQVENGEVLGATDDGGIGFEVQEGRVLVAARQATLLDALAWAEVTDEDLVATWTV